MIAIKQTKSDAFSSSFSHMPVAKSYRSHENKIKANDYIDEHMTPNSSNIELHSYKQICLFDEEKMDNVSILPKIFEDLSEEITVLIIDDSDTDRMLYKTWLNKHSKKRYRFVEAANGREGYTAFLKSAPACIILDFKMQGKDGFQLLIELKREYKEMPPVIFVTGMNSDIVKEDAMIFGANIYLDKNKLTRETLNYAVDKALA